MQTQHSQHSSAVFEMNDNKPEFNPYSTAIHNQEDSTFLSKEKSIKKLDKSPKKKLPRKPQRQLSKIIIDKADLYKNTVFVAGGNLDTKEADPSGYNEEEQMKDNPVLGYIQKTSRKNFTQMFPQNSDVKVGGQIFASDQSLQVLNGSNQSSKKRLRNQGSPPSIFGKDLGKGSSGARLILH